MTLLMRQTRYLQLTLAILKPEVTSHPHIAREIKELILKHDFQTVKHRELMMSRAMAANFYKEHEGRFFHNRLVTYMSSGPITAMVLARDDAISYWRKLMGPTKVFRTIYKEPFSVRGRYGLTDTRNCCHGSDSKDSARREISFFFPEFSIDDWYKYDEVSFRSGKAHLDTKQGIHVCQMHTHASSNTLKYVKDIVLENS